MDATRFFKSTLVALATMGMASSASAQVCAEAPESMIGWWPGDGTDEGLISNLDARRVGQVDFSPGWVGEAFQLDGVLDPQNARVVMPHDAVDGLADMTVELWVNTTDAVGGLVSAANGNSPGGNELLLFQGSSGIDVWVKQQKVGTVPIFISDGAWHHVAFVREGSSGHLYVDAVLVDSQTYPVGPLEVGPLGLLIGQDQDCLGGCFQTSQALDGLVDEVAIYGRALAESELRAVFDAGTAGKCKPAPTMASTDDALLDQVDALASEVEMLHDRLAEAELRLEVVASETHVHDDTAVVDGHTDDEDDDRRWNYKGKRRGKWKKFHRR